MLKKLVIDQFVIIDRLELEFNSGLTVITGETGAGKSILLGAMSLILGAPANTKSIRQGSDRSIIEALLAPPKDNPVWKLLIVNDLAETSDEEFLIHRTIEAEGENKILINDKPVELELLAEMGELLIEIHGQFANQSLLGPENQMRLLDLSGDFPPEVFKNVADALHDVHRYEKELKEEKDFLVLYRGLRLKKLEQLVRKFESIGMYKGFTVEAKREYNTLLTAKETSEAFQAILAQLISGNGVALSLSTANKTLAKIGGGEKMEKLTGYLAAALENTHAAVDEMGKLAPDYDIDTAPLHKYKKILAVMQEISTNEKVPFEELDDFYEDVSTKLKRVKNGRERVAELEDLLIKAKRDYRHHAHILTEKRIAAGEALSEAITKELAPLKLMKAEFRVVVEEKQDAEWTELGFNEVTFIARMNPGTPFSPISETASGGELARMILALKVILQKVQKTPTLVFDEVDTGIGGLAAAAVGERIAQLAEETQVLVITHSPQVASRGDVHLRVQKKTDGVTTVSTVTQLSQEERIDEISHMLAGDKVTDASRAAAQSLLDEATAAAEKRRNT